MTSTFVSLELESDMTSIDLIHTFGDRFRVAFDRMACCGLQRTGETAMANSTARLVPENWA
jgi:hypothetical protein